MKAPVVLVLLSSYTMAQPPSMQEWTRAWSYKEADAFKELYDIQALIFPPNRPAVQGNENILVYMHKGMGKTNVLFEPEEVHEAHQIIFEQGIFKDVAPTSGEVIATGRYAVVWVLTGSTRKIKSHS